MTMMTPLIGVCEIPDYENRSTLIVTRWSLHLLFYCLQKNAKLTKNLHNSSFGKGGWDVELRFLKLVLRSPLFFLIFKQAPTNVCEGGGGTGGLVPPLAQPPLAPSTNLSPGTPDRNPSLIP